MKYKKLPSVIFSYLSDARSANATQSLNPGQLGILGRKKPTGHAIADLISAKGDEFSREYISPDKTGKQILKSDKYLIKGSHYFEVEKKKYPHHHISSPDEQEKRLVSIIKARKK